MSLSPSNNSALWRWLQGLVPVIGRGHPVVDANVISGGALTPEEQRELYTVAPLTATGSGAIAESFPVTATSKIAVAVTFKSGGAAVKPTTVEYITVSIDSDLGAAFDRVIGRSNPAQTTTPPPANPTGDFQQDNYPQLALDGDAILVAYPNTDANDWTVEVTLGVPS